MHKLIALINTVSYKYKLTYTHLFHAYKRRWWMQRLILNIYEWNIKTYTPPLSLLSHHRENRKNVYKISTE